MRCLSFVCLFCFFPALALAQVAESTPVEGGGVPKAVQIESSTEAQNTKSGADNAQPVDGKSTTSRVRRGKRVIVNREFDDREKITLLLNAHCDFPTKEDLLSTSADAEKHLHSILNDASVLFSVRRRALEALAYFETEYSHQMLEWILSHPDEIKHPLMLMQAIRSYPQIAPDKAPDLLEPYLASDNDMIRFVTISALKNCPGNSALNVLKRRYAIEKNRFFQARLKQAMDGHCQQETYCTSSR